MTKDYSKKGGGGGNRPQAKPKGGGSQLPGWAWMASGLLVGLFVAFLVYLNQLEQSEPARPRPAERAAAPEKDKGAGISFDFYKILPEQEVVIPEEELKGPDVQRKASNAEPIYVQAGSFRNAGDADTRKAQLAMLGLVSEIQTVQVEGKPWHRVRVGPLEDQRGLDKVRRLLQDNNIGFIMVREKKS